MEMPKWAKWLLGFIAFAAATVGIVWLSGFLFFVFSKTMPFGKTHFSTWSTYWHFYQGVPIIAKRLKVSATVAVVICYGVPLAAIINAMTDVRSLHGEARFANAGEIENAGLLGKAGIIIGKWKNRFLMFPGMQFVLLAAPTRSGKGVGIVIPNLLNFDQSVVVLDVKLENFLITSKFRAKHGQEVYLFNPFDENGKTHRFNPLGYISDNPRLRVADILSIGYALYPGAGRDPFFDDAARNLFLGLTLYLCETPDLPCTIGELLRQSSGKGKPVKTYLQSLIHARNYLEVDDVDNEGKPIIKEGKPVKKFVPITQWDGKGLPLLSMECVDALNRFTATSDNTLSSILASFNTPLTLWVSPLVDAATSANDFDLRDVRKKRMSIYVGIPTRRLAEAELLVNLFFSQLINLNLDDLLFAKPELQYQCLMLMDEFAAPGRINIIDKTNAYMAGYGMRLLTIIQTPAQIAADPRKGYGKESARTLITNHAAKILYTPQDQHDANEYSEMLGYYTHKALSRSRQRGGKNTGGRSESESDQKRALMLPQELKEMSQREQIVTLENSKAIKCEKIAFYDDHVFLDRLKSVSPTLAALDNTPLRNNLRKIGIIAKAKPTKEFFETTWGAGELAVHVPCIDLDLHDAKVQKRSRPMTTADIAKGIDLRKLAFDTSKIPIPPDGDGCTPEQAKDLTNSFFDAMDSFNEDDVELSIDDTGSRLSDDELASQAAKAAKFNSDEGDGLTVVEETEITRVVVVEPTEEDLTAMMPTFKDKASILDLSVLLKPLPQNGENILDRQADAGLER